MIGPSKLKILTVDHVNIIGRTLPNYQEVDMTVHKADFINYVGGVYRDMKQ